MPVCKDTCLVKEASKTASQDKPPVEPTTPRERLRELAREKRMRREFMARIEPGSPVFGMLHRHAGDPGKRDATGGVPGLSDLPEGDPCRRMASTCEHTGYKEVGAFENRTAAGAKGATTKALALNSIKAWREYVDRTVPGSPVVHASKFGSPGSSLQDAGRLGATVVRQLGSRDLWWSFIRPRVNPQNNRELGEGEPVPVFGSDPTASSLIEFRARANEMAELLTLSKARGIKVHLTFLLMIGGGDEDDTPPPSGYAMGCTHADDYQHWRSGSMVAAPFAPLVWEHVGQKRTHVGEQDHDPNLPHYFPIRGDACIPWMSWHLDTLDPSAPYKRSYMQYIGQVAANILERAERLVCSGGETISDYVETIELFNEASGRSRYYDGSGRYDPEASGEMWGRACAHAAYGLRAGLGDQGVRIALPGVASYDIRESGTEFSWDGRKRFVSSMVRYFVLGLLDEIPYPGVMPNELPTYLQGIDFHWYHDESGKTCHVGYFVHDVEELRGVVEDGLRAGLEDAADRGLLDRGLIDEYVLTTMADFVITALETGCPAVGNEDNSLPPGFDSHVHFQAFEVWRRLGGALASSAVAAGWHDWMSPQSGGFAAFGLRADTGAEDSPTEFAFPRDSWFAYQRLASLLGNVTIDGGRMVLPSVADRGELSRTYPPSGSRFSPLADRSPAVVFEYQREDSDYPWAYLLFADPWGTLLTEGDAYLIAHARSGAAAVRVPTEPDSIVVLPSSAGSLPERSATYSGWWSALTGMPIHLRRGDMPVLVLAKGKIEWESYTLEVSVLENLDTPVIADPGQLRASGVEARIAAQRGWNDAITLLRGLCVQRPAWMDDPSIAVKGV